ncbi:MAG: PLDc N-terminal domain-containing protein [Gammaproteobacteria bacterium]|nr:PLDc N-terminal domain-containing protein [Gammaproteobacteria bacterium]
MFGILVLFADIYAILKIFQSGATTSMKAIWILALLLLPLLGFIAWFFVGPGSKST